MQNAIVAGLVAENRIKTMISTVEFNRIILNIFRVSSRIITLWNIVESNKMILYSIFLVILCSTLQISSAADPLTFKNWFSFGMNALSDIFLENNTEKPCGDR